MRGLDSTQDLQRTLVFRDSTPSLPHLRVSGSGSPSCSTWHMYFCSFLEGTTTAAFFYMVPSPVGLVFISSMSRVCTSPSLFRVGEFSRVEARAQYLQVWDDGSHVSLGNLRIQRFRDCIIFTETAGQDMETQASRILCTLENQVEPTQSNRLQVSKRDIGF